MARRSWGLPFLLIGLLGIVAFYSLSREREPTSTVDEEPGSLPCSESIHVIDIDARVHGRDHLEDSATPDRRVVELSGWASGKTMVLVRILEEVDEDPVPGVDVLIRRHAPRIEIEFDDEGLHMDFGRALRKAMFSLTGLGRVRTSDPEGLVEYPVPPGVPLVLRAHLLSGPRELDIKPLEEGERREVLVRVPRAGLLFHGMVVERGTERPLCEIPATLHHDNGDLLCMTTTDANGRFEFRAPREELRVSIGADGWGTVLGRVTTGHETPNKAEVYRLYRSASLKGTVLDQAEGRVAGAHLGVAAFSGYLNQPTPDIHLHFQRPDPPGDPLWETTTDRNGTFLLDDLPPRTLLYATAFSEAGSVARVAPLSLEPGEERRITIVIGPQARVHGRAFDQHGNAIQGLKVWLIEVDPMQSRYLLPDIDEPEQQAETDQAGAFQFEEVAPGTWILGPDPGESETGFLVFGAKKKRRESYAPVGVGLAIVPGDVEKRIDLEVARARYCRGVVVDPGDNPVPGAIVSARSEHWGLAPGARTDKDGRFVLGPLADEPHALTASGGIDYRESEVTSVRPGESDIVLRLRSLGSRIKGTVFLQGSSSEGCRIRVLSLDRLYQSTLSAERDGTFETHPLASGHYAVIASEGELIGGAPDVFVPSSDEAVFVEIRLAETSRLRVTYFGESLWALVATRSNGVLMDATVVRFGTSNVLSAPLGLVAVELRPFEALHLENPFQNWMAKTVEVRQVEVQRNKELEIVFR